MIAGPYLFESDDLEKPVDALVKHIKSIIDDDWKKNDYKIMKPVLSVTKGGRYWRIVLENPQTKGKSVWGFVDTTNGNVLKANGWKAPHPTPRGNINDKSTWKGFGQYGPQYLR
jgi:hypothetical protein